MPYRLRARDRSVAEGVRRIACEQIDKATASIDSPENREQAIHEVRTRCKKLRGLLRLVRPELDGFHQENAAFRDIARQLSGLREAEVLQNTYDRLLERADARVDRRALGQIRRRFTLQRKADLERTDLAGRFQACREELAGARDRVKGWEIAADGWDGVAGGLEWTYARARSAAKRAREERTAAAYHELRKQLKYHLHHSLLLRRLWPKQMKVRAALATRVTELLGDHHDLAALEMRIAGDGWAFSDNHSVQAALDLASARRHQLAVQVWPLIGRLLAERPGALLDRWEALWINWRRGGA